MSGVLPSVKKVLYTHMANIVKRIFRNKNDNITIPTIFQILLLRLFLIAICSLIFESCSAITSLSSSSVIVPSSNMLTFVSKISAISDRTSESGTDSPFSYLLTVCLTTFNLIASSSCVYPFAFRIILRFSSSIFNVLLMFGNDNIH